MQHRRQGDERVPLKHWLYLAIVLALVGVIHDRDFEVAQIGERMRYEELCKENTRIAVAALGGEKIIYPDPHRQMWRVSVCEVHDTGYVEKK